MKNKPPLGVMPRHVHEQLRIQDLTRAIQRYAMACRHIPNEWIEELKELNDRNSNRGE